MIYKIVIKKRVEKFLSRCDKNIKESFLNKVLLFEKDPFTAIQKSELTCWLRAVQSIKLLLTQNA